VDQTLVFQVLIIAPGYEPTFFRRVDPLNGPLAAVLKPRPKLDLPARQTVAGRVVDGKGNPVPRAVVSVESIRTENTTSGRLPEGTDPLAITDDRGEFFLASQSAFDSLELQVEARGFARRGFMDIRGGSQRQDLKVTEGAYLTGRVLKDGGPLSGITVGAVSSDRRIGEFTGNFEMATDETGCFLIRNLPPGRQYDLYGVMSSLQHQGTLPARKIQMGSDGSTNDLGTLSVVPGRRLAGHVRLSDNQPLPDGTKLVIGRKDAWDSLVVELTPEGRFDVSNIPAESLSVHTRVRGYRHSARNASLDRLNPFGLAGRLDTDKTDLTILLEPGEPLPSEFGGEPAEERPENLPLFGIEGKPKTVDEWVITGRVSDAETKAPLASFRVTPSRRPSADSYWAPWQNARMVEGTNGTFRLALSRKGGLVVLMAEAKGYLPEISPAFAWPQTNCDLVLKKGTGPTGVVLLPNGQPATNAEVFYAGPGDQLNLMPGARIAAGQLPKNAIAKTDTQGRFKFAPRAGECDIIAVADTGMARLRATELGATGQVNLLSWVTVKGRLMRQGKPVANEAVDVVSSTGSYRPDRPLLHLHGTQTDDEGRFKIDHLPPGELQISTRLTIGSGPRTGWSNLSQKAFTAQPGETVDLGEVEKKESRENP
jgi:uncharacterized GH25 family protein